MGRIMAIDYGDQRTGVAVSDLLGILCGEAVTIEEWNAERLAQKLTDFAKARQVELLLLGLPKNMDGTEGPRAELYKAFAAQVEEATGMKPVLWDERRTTIDAHRILFEAGKNAKKRKKTVDAVAASLILEGYLTFKKVNG